MSEAFWKKFRELVHGPDRVAAHRVENDAIRRAEAAVMPAEFRREQERLRATPARTHRLGRFTEGASREEDFLVDLHELLAHQLVLGDTGSGKTYQTIQELIALARKQVIASAVILDMKGELAELLTDQAFPALAASLPPADADALLRRIVVIDPFSSTHLPPLNVLVRDPGQPLAIQARDVAECFEAATETDVSVRMETILDWVLRLVIETGGSFLTVRRALQEPAVLEGLVRTAKDPDTIRYFLTRYPSEPKTSKLALLSRLDRFLALPMTQLSLGAKSCVDFDRLLEDHITIVSLGKAPAGLQSVARFFAMVVFTRFVRAIFRRPPRAQGFASLIVADEWQVALNAALAKEFEAILTLARSRGVHLWLSNQQLAQLDRHGATLKSVVLGLTANQVFFRLADEDCRALKRIFPVTGAVRRKGSPGNAAGSPFLTPAEETEARAVAAARLPNRDGYWNDRRRSWGAIPFRSATVHLPPSSSLPPQYVARAKRGVIIFTVADLEQMRDDEDRRLDRLAAGPVRAQPKPAAPVAAPAPAPAPAPAVPPPSPGPAARPGRAPKVPQLPAPQGAPAPRRPPRGGLPPIR
ncbi:MAG: DUF87 domain-containing protein [Deltaproteobacteria bacterium]|nr:DUF87 domain-containing protein [Myxococcales bacterium]MDP3217077.1 DUF87 domain-containing protein [Deltaproteobacteria bacterium]